MNKEPETLDLNEVMKDFGAKPSIVVPDQSYYIKYKGTSAKSIRANAPSFRDNAPQVPVGFANAPYLPCVEHIAQRIADKWAGEYDRVTYDRLTNALCQRLANH